MVRCLLFDNLIVHLSLKTLTKAIWCNLATVFTKLPSAQVPQLLIDPKKSCGMNIIFTRASILGYSEIDYGINERPVLLRKYIS